MKFKVFSQRALIGAGLLMVGITSAQSQIREESQGMVLLRSLPTLDTSYSMTTVELDPESDQFGEILCRLGNLRRGKGIGFAEVVADADLEWLSQRLGAEHRSANH